MALKQAPRASPETLGFMGSKIYPLLFIYSRKGTTLYIVVYVHDVIVTSNNAAAIDHIVNQLSKAFALKDLGPLNYFLGLEIVPQGSNVILSQRRNILDLLQRPSHSISKSVPSSMTTSTQLYVVHSVAFSDLVKYRQIVGALQYETLSWLVTKCVNLCMPRLRTIDADSTSSS